MKRSEFFAVALDAAKRINARLETKITEGKAREIAESATAVFDDLGEWEPEVATPFPGMVKGARVRFSEEGREANLCPIFARDMRGTVARTPRQQKTVAVRWDGYKSIYQYHRDFIEPAL